MAHSWLEIGTKRRWAQSKFKENEYKYRQSRRPSARSNAEYVENRFLFGHTFLLFFFFCDEQNIRIERSWGKRWRYIEIIRSKITILKIQSNFLSQNSLLWVLAHWTRCYHTHLLSHLICLMGICVKISSPKSAAARDFLLLFSFFLKFANATRARSSFDLRGYKEHLHFFVVLKFQVKSTVFQYGKRKQQKMYRAVHPFGTWITWVLCIASIYMAV